MFTAPSGQGEGGRRSVAALKRAGVPVSTHTIVLGFLDNNVPFPDDDPTPAKYDTALFHTNIGPVHRDFIIPHPAARRIVFLHWDLPVFPPRWVPDFAIIDEIWTPSRYDLDLMSAATDLPVRLVPHPAVLEPTDRDAARTALGLPAERRILLTVFDFRSFPARKNPDALIRAFRDAFPPGSDTPLLVVKYQGSGPHDAAHVALINETPNVQVIDRTMTYEQMRMLYSAVDGFVSLHRAEGFGFNVFDSMTIGKACIATAFSGNLDYMTEENSMLIPYTPRLVGHGEYLHGHGQWWADPDHDAAVEALRWFGRAPESALRRMGDRARADIARGFSLDRVGAIARAAWRGEAPPPAPGAPA